MPGTLVDRINELSEEVSSLSAQIKTEDLDRELKAAQINLANHNTVITEIRSELAVLHKEFDDFKHSVCKEIEDLKRELISYIILSNASKGLDTVALTESARHLASGVTPASHVG